MNTQPYIDPHKAKFMFTIYLADKQFFSDLFVHGKVQLSLAFSISLILQITQSLQIN